MFDATSGRLNGSEKPAEGVFEQSIRSLDNWGFAGGNGAFKDAPAPAGAEATAALEKEGKLNTMTSDGNGWNIAAAGGENLFANSETTNVGESSRAAAEQQEAPQAA